MSDAPSERAPDVVPPDTVSPDVVRPAVHPVLDGVIALAVIAAVSAVIFLLARIDPDPRGHATHERLGLPRCSWPDAYGIPCPTCGCTTAAAHLVHLAPLRAFATQPFGACFLLAGVTLAVIALRSLVRRESFVERIALWPHAKIVLAAVALLLLSWLYKYLTWTG